MAFRASRLYWRLVGRLRISDDQQSIFWAIVIGAAGGLAAFVFNVLIQGLRQFFFSDVPLWLGYDQPTATGWQLVQPWIPAIGGLIVGPLVYLAIEAKGHGVPEVMLAMAREGGRIRPRVGAIKATASAVTLGSGGSGGQEGPIVQIGSAVGSLIGQVFQMPSRKVKTFVACGAAAGISAVFNAPIAGVFFAIEVLLGELRTRSFSFVVIASAMAWIVSRQLMGTERMFDVPPWEFEHSAELFLWVILGIFAAALGRLFVLVLYWFEDLFSRMRLSVLLRPALGGLLVGIVGIALPHVFSSGYKPMNAALSGTVFTRLEALNPTPFDPDSPELLVPVLPTENGLEAPLLTQEGTGAIFHAIAILAILALAKIIATSLTLGSGGSGGVFAPSLFIGGMFGAAFGLALQLGFPGETGPPGAYAMLGMAATFSAAAHAPVTSILIIFEITNYNQAMLPGLMVSSVVAILLAYRLAGDSIYTVKFKRRGWRIGDTQARDPMKQIQVRDAMATEFFTVHATMTMRQALLYAETVGQRAYPVVGERETEMLGLITLYDLNLAMAGNRPDTTPIQELMDPEPLVATPEDHLDHAVHLLGQTDSNILPVIASKIDRRLIGVLSHATIIRAYNEYQMDRE